MRPLVAHCHAGLGAIARHSDKPRAAREHFVVAARMYRELDMPFWLPDVEKNV
jgi:hypothetical protein